MARMTISRKKEALGKKVIMHRIADVRGGLGIKTSVLAGSELPEGSVVGAPVNGQCEVLKIAKVYADATNADTTYKVCKGHHFKVGDIITAGTNKKAYTISAIDASNAAYDVFTVGTTLGVVVKAGAFLMAAKAEAASGSALAVAPFGITGTTEAVDPASNLQMDIWVMAVTKDADIPSDVLALLKGIINY